MKILKVNDFQNFSGIKNKRNKNKVDILAPITQEDKEYKNKLEQAAINMNTKASLAVAAALLAGAIGTGTVIYSAKRPVNHTEASTIPSDIADSSYVDIPAIQESDIFYVDNNYGVTNKTNPTDTIEVEPATEKGNYTDKETAVEVEVPHESKNSEDIKQPVNNEHTNSTEDVEYIEDSEIIDETEDVEYVYEP